MRKFVLSMFVAVAVLFSGTICFAAGGSAVMPTYLASSATNISVYHTN